MNTTILYILYIATNCNIIVFMAVCICRYIYICICLYIHTVMNTCICRFIHIYI